MHEDKTTTTFSRFWNLLALSFFLEGGVRIILGCYFLDVTDLDDAIAFDWILGGVGVIKVSQWHVTTNGSSIVLNGFWKCSRLVPHNFLLNDSLLQQTCLGRAGSCLSPSKPSTLSSWATDRWAKRVGIAETSTGWRSRWHWLAATALALSGRAK